VLAATKKQITAGSKNRHSMRMQTTMAKPSLATDRAFGTLKFDELGLVNPIIE
jgi:hypothetical protein